MKLTLILAAFSSILTCIVQAICTPGGITDVSLNFVNKVIFGTKKGGFSLTCQYSFTGAYNLYLWRIDKYNGISFDTIYTHIPGLNPPVSQAGPNYSSRNLTLQNMDTVVFPDMMISDVGNDTYRCTVQFNLSAVSCEESPVLKTNIAADTVTDIGDFKSGSLPVESTVQVKVTGTDYLPYDMAVTRFLVNIDGNNKTLNIITTDQADGLEAFTSNVSLQTPATHEKNINFAVYMVVDDSSIIVAEKIFRTEPTTDSNVSTTAATNTTTTITSTVIPTTVTENSSQSSIDIQLSVLIPVVSLVVIILIIIVVYCVVVSFRNRRAKENERNSKDQFSMNNKL